MAPAYRRGEFTFYSEDLPQKYGNPPEGGVPLGWTRSDRFTSGVSLTIKER